MFSLVVPTYNEAENVCGLVSRVAGALEGRAYELIFVDDNSPDKTWKIAETAAAKDSRVRVIRRMTNRGLSSAAVEGLRQSRGEILGVMDADLSHDPAILPEMIRTIEAGADMVIGSRRVKGGGADRWPWHRRLTSNVATGLARSIVPVKVSDPMSGYFVLKREIFQSVKDRLRPKGYKIMLEIACRARPKRIEEVPFVFRDRRQGYSKLTPKVMLHFVEMIFELRFGFSPLDPLRRFRHRL